MEDCILNWLEVGDTIQKLDVYNNKLRTNFFKIFYNISKNMYFSEYLHYLLIIIFFAHIWELNIADINVENDRLLQIINYLQPIFLFEKMIKSEKTYEILILISNFFFLISTILLIINVISLLNGIYLNVFLKIFSFVDLLFIYYFSGPFLHIFTFQLFELKGAVSAKNYFLLVMFILGLIFSIIMNINIILTSLYMSDINTINGMNYKSKINDRYMTIIIVIKIIYFILEAFISLVFKDKKLFLYGYLIILFLINLFMSIYSYKKVFYYNNVIDILHHFGWYYSTWLSICIIFKILTNTKDMTLFLIFGFLLIIISSIFSKRFKLFKLLTEFNILEGNKLKDIEMYSNLLFQLSQKNDPKNNTLLAGIIKKSEECLKSDPEINDIYSKFVSKGNEHKLFNSVKEQKVLCLVGVIYVNNEQKSKNKANVSLNRCYFVLNKLKNASLATFIATKINPNNHIEAYYKYVLLEEIKSYMINKLKKNRNKLSMKNLQLSSVILYNQLVDIFKIEIYDAICSQIEYFDILKNNVTTDKATENLLKTGEGILSIRNNIINIWNKMIELNPSDSEAERDYMLYLDFILQDEFLKKEEIKKYKDKKEEFYTEKNNIYFEMFNMGKSAILLCDGYSFNGKIFYYTPNFASLFGFTGKEISNITIEDLLPDVVQSFHKYLLEENIKYTNLMVIFKKKKNILLKGKNGLLFNIYLYLRILPNLQYGMLYILYIQKIEEKNFMIILNDKMHIDGFTESGQMNSNFTVNNVTNYGLSQLVIGYHIGLIIPDIILQIDYDPKTEKFFFTKENVDLKGYFYPTYNTKEMNNQIQKLLDLIKEKKMKEIAEENNNENFNSYEEYNDFIKEINSQNKKPFSIFYRIECRKFIQGKYRYYKIYITSDLLSDNFNEITSNTKNNYVSNTDNNIKDNNSITDNPSKNNEKMIKLKIDSNKNNFENLKKKKINNGDENIKDKNNNENSKDLNINPTKINFSQPTSTASSVLSKTNKESNEFHKLKNQIINKKDITNIRIIKYLLIYYFVFIAALIAYNYFYTQKVINSLSEFLAENLYFENTKIACACTFNSALNLKLLRRNIINNEDCPNSNCTSFYPDLLVKSFTEIRKLKYNLNDFYPDFQDIFLKKIIVNYKRFKFDEEKHFNLDIDNYFNFLIANGLKIIANITNYFGEGNYFGFSSYEIIDIYIDNILSTSYNFFKSDFYKEFKGKEKEKRCKVHSDNPPKRLLIAIACFIIVIGILIYLTCKINSTEIFFLDKLINFSSTSFEEYLKKLEDLKKSIRDENTDDEDKNMDDIDEDMENKSENGNDKSLNKNEDGKEKLNKKKDNLKKKRNKQNKLHLQKLKKRKNMSNYFFKVNCLFSMKIAISFLLLIIYFIITLLIFANYQKNFSKFDHSIVQINSIYMNIYETFLNFKKQIETFFISKNEEDIIIPKDSDLAQPKLGNTLFDIIHNSKYNKESLEKIKILYNENACQILNKDVENDKYCETLFSSILVKGLDQVIVQMSIIINNCIDDLTTLKATKNLTNFYSINNYYYNYEMLVGYYLFNSFLATKDIFDVFREDEKKYIYNIQKAITVIYSIFVVIIAILCFYFIYQYKNIGNSFWNFIGILPNKYISDDENFYDSIIKLGEFLY